MILAFAAMFLALCASGAARNYRSEWRNYHSFGQGRTETDRPTGSKYQTCESNDLLFYCKHTYVVRLIQGFSVAKTTPSLCRRISTSEFFVAK